MLYKAKENLCQQFGMFTEGLHKQPWKAGDDVISPLTRTLYTPRVNDISQHRNASGNHAPEKINQTGVN